MKTKKTILKNIITFGSIGAAALVFAGCGSNAQTATTAAGGDNTAQVESAAAKSVTLEVVNSAGETKHYDSNTEAEYLRGVMDELKDSTDFTYEGSESTSGIFIEAVNGESASYATDGAYWAIYVNDDYATSGADTQVVKDGDAFKLVYEKAN